MLGAELRGVGPQQHDVARLDAIAAQLRLRVLEMTRQDLVAGLHVRQIQHHAIAVAQLDRNAFRARRVRLHVAPRIDVRADVIAGDDHAVIGDLVDAEAIGADALRHLRMRLHLDDDRLGHVRIGHHALIDVHAEIDQPALSHPYLFPCHPPSTKIDWPVR